MKIYLWYFGEGWKLVEGDYSKLKNLFDERGIHVSDSATIGDFATIGYSAIIGNYATIPPNFNDSFSELNILIMVGVVMYEGKGTFYKAVKPDLTDFYWGDYQYREGKGDENEKLERDQSVDCGKGWHWTSYERAVAFAECRPHAILSSEIDIKDILSVYNKVRVKKFGPVKVVKLE